MSYQTVLSALTSLPQQQGIRGIALGSHQRVLFPQPDFAPRRIPCEVNMHELEILSDHKAGCRCSDLLPRTAFYGRGRGRHGVLSECRRCCTARRRQSRHRQRLRLTVDHFVKSSRDRPASMAGDFQRTVRRLGGEERMGALLAEAFTQLVREGTTAQMLRAFGAASQMVASHRVRDLLASPTSEPVAT